MNFEEDPRLKMSLDEIQTLCVSDLTAVRSLSYEISVSENVALVAKLSAMHALINAPLGEERAEGWRGLAHIARLHGDEFDADLFYETAKKRLFEKGVHIESEASAIKMFLGDLRIFGFGYEYGAKHAYEWVTGSVAYRIFVGLHQIAQYDSNLSLVMDQLSKAQRSSEILLREAAVHGVSRILTRSDLSDDVVARWLDSISMLVTDAERDSEAYVKETASYARYFLQSTLSGSGKGDATL